MVVSCSITQYSPTTTCAPMLASACTRAVAATVAEGSMAINLYHTGVLVTEIAELLDTRWEGEGEHEIFGAAPLPTAAADQLSFVSNRKALAEAEKSHAGCLIVPHDFPPGR